METVSTLLAICAVNSPVPGEFPAQSPVTRNFDVFFDLRPNKLLSKQSWGWWFETPSHPLWRHLNGGLHKMVDILQAIFSIAFSWLEIIEFDSHFTGICYYILKFENVVAKMAAILSRSHFGVRPFWRHSTGSTLDQVIASCLTTPSHYLNQCRVIISEVHFTKDASEINYKN